jgi:VCBS repeat-containing protein
VDTGDTLTYSIAETSGTYGSIAIDSATGEWTYTLSNTDTDTDALAASASVTETFSAVVTDAAAAQSTAQTITITITGANDAPVSAVIADQSIAEDSTLSFVVPDGSFADVDSGDSLTYTATLADGSELPTSWLSFDGNTKTFSGTPTNDAVGNIEVAVTATDSASASISDTYTLTVSNTNDVPTLETTLVDQSATEGTEFSYAIASGSFADVDSGDTLTYTATQTGGAARPSWLSFDGDTQTFSGTPTAEATLDITVTASDGTAMITDAFSLTVANTNDAPVFTSSASVSTTERTYLADTVTATDEETEDDGWRHIEINLIDHLRGFNRFRDKDVPNATFIQWDRIID